MDSTIKVVATKIGKGLAQTTLATLAGIGVGHAANLGRKNLTEGIPTIYRLKRGLIEDYEIEALKNKRGKSRLERAKLEYLKAQQKYKAQKDPMAPSTAAFEDDMNQKAKEVYGTLTKNVGKGIGQATLAGLAAVFTGYVLSFGKKNLTEGIPQAYKLAKNSIRERRSGT